MRNCGKDSLVLLLALSAILFLSSCSFSSSGNVSVKTSETADFGDSNEAIKNSEDIARRAVDFDHEPDDV
ncbi:MAG: hypothetical protein K5796_01760 [Lachnospiraceae bacterium]|nr:hypothetical protein [Lachnospiraceae bacterium]